MTATEKRLTEKQSAEILAAYAEAQDTWLGLNWPTVHGTYEIYIDGMDAAVLRSAARAADSEEDYDCSYTRKFWKRFVREPEAIDRSRKWSILADELRSAAGFLDRVEESAAEAESRAKDAMLSVENGDFGQAARDAKALRSVESEYGDAPTWGKFCDLVEQAAG